VGSGKTLKTLGFAALAALLWAGAVPAGPAGSAGPAGATGSAGPGAAPTTTTTVSPLDGPLGQQLGALAQRDEEASVSELNLLNQMQATKATLADVTAKESALDAQVSARQGQLADAQRRLDIADQQVTDTEATLSSVQADLAAARDDVRRQAIAAYIGRPVADVGTSLSDAASTTSVLDRLSYLSSLADTERQAVDRLVELNRRSVTLERDVRQAEADARARRDGLRADVAQLAAARQQQEALRQSAQSTSLKQAFLLAQIQAQKTTVESQLAALAAQSASITTELHALQAGESVSAASIAAGKGMFALPIPGAPITSGFGPRIDPVYGDVRIHTGIDFGAPTGTPILASAGGTVVVAGVVTGYGNCTIIDAGSGFANLYGHQSVLLVHPGQHVVQGQLIGLVGSTGFSTGPHLHFEIRVNGTPVDPMPFLTPLTR
jgi:murein DD-endopeptidase MepM/ murein hydrolase activator NlpD